MPISVAFAAPPLTVDNVTLQQVGQTISVKDAGIGATQIATPVRDFVWVIRGGTATGADASLGNVTDGDTLFLHVLPMIHSAALTATESAAVSEAPVAFTIDGFAVYSPDNTLAGVATWTLRKEGGDTGMTAASVASTNGNIASTGSAVAYTAGDSIGLKVVGPAPVVSGIYRPYVVYVWGRKA